MASRDSRRSKSTRRTRLLGVSRGAGNKRDGPLLELRAVAFWDEIEALERRLISQALAMNRGNASAAARHLGLDRVTLFRKVAAFGLTAMTQRRRGRPSARIDVPPLAPAYWPQVRGLERALLTEALTQFRGNTSRAAAWLRMHRVSFIHKAAALGLRGLQSRQRGRGASLVETAPRGKAPAERRIAR